MRILTLLPFLFGLPSFATFVDVQMPRLLIPLKKSDPDHAFGTRFTGEVSQSVHTEVSFDLNPNIQANICRINFHINTNAQKNAPRELSGDAPFQFLVHYIVGGINEDRDTWKHHPQVTYWVATITLTPEGGVSVDNGWFSCPVAKNARAQFLLIPLTARPLRYWWYQLDYPWSEGGPHGITLEMHT